MLPEAHLSSDNLNLHYDAIDEALHLIPSELYKIDEFMPPKIKLLLTRHFSEPPNSKAVKHQLRAYISDQVDQINHTSY